MATCRGCEAPIEWAMTDAGKSMPLDAAPSSTGTWVFMGGKTRKATNEDKRLARPLYRPHWASCPAAPSFRGKK
jgi:hypothetical protein